MGCYVCRVLPANVLLSPEQPNSLGFPRAEPEISHLSRHCNQRHPHNRSLPALLLPVKAKKGKEPPPPPSATIALSHHDIVGRRGSVGRNGRKWPFTFFILFFFCVVANPACSAKVGEEDGHGRGEESRLSWR